MLEPCSRCSSRESRWVTMRRPIPVDVRQCTACGLVLEEEDWVPPFRVLYPERCINCGDRRVDEICIACGLSREEDHQVHDTLRDHVAPDENMLAAARNASRQGRRLLALKLATAAAARDAGGQGEVAHALRIWLLSAIGEAPRALDDAKAWVDRDEDPSHLAWASYGQQLQHQGYPGAAADAYGKALVKEPARHGIRATRAKLLLELHREGQALNEIATIFHNTDEPKAIAQAINTAESLLGFYDKTSRDDEIDILLGYVGRHTNQSALLLGHRARLAAAGGNVAEAKRDLKAARQLEPDLPIYDRVLRLLKSARTSWWRW